MAPRQPKAVTKRNRHRNPKPQRPTTKREELPLPLRDLKGAEQLTVDRKPGRGERGRGTEFPGGVWRLQLTLPENIKDLKKTGMDPLIPAYFVAVGIRDLQVRLEELVRVAREEGHSWTKIGEALGMSRQAAWDKYSGEE